MAKIVAKIVAKISCRDHSLDCVDYSGPGCSTFLGVRCLGCPIFGLVDAPVGSDRPTRSFIPDIAACERPNRRGVIGATATSAPVIAVGLVIGKPRSAAGKRNEHVGRMSLEHDPEKWAPVFRKDHAQTKS